MGGLTAEAMDEAPSDWGPVTYAYRLAGYLKDPKYIDAKTREEWGQSPGVARIEKMMEKHKRLRDEFARGVIVNDYNEANDDGEPWKPTKFRIAKPKKPKTLWPSWYVPPAPAKGPATAREIITAAARKFGFTYEEMISVHRGKQISRARQTVYAILRARGNSYPQIGRWMNRDHSSVVHGCTMFDRYAQDAPLMYEVYERFVGARHG